MALNDTPTHLDSNQIFQRAFDETSDRLRVDVATSVQPGTMHVAIDMSEDSIKIGDGVDLMAVNSDGSINVNVVSGGSGGSSSGNIVDGVNSALKATVTSSNALKVDNSGVTQPVSGTVAISNLPASQPVTGSFYPATQPISAASLPLPTGAATSANQSTQNTTLSAISAQLPATLGSKTAAASLPVTIASDQATLPVSGSVAITSLPSEKKSIVDEATSTVTYIGYASPGTATSSASWKIKRITLSGTLTLIEWAGGSVSMTNIWDNRASLGYS